MNARELFEELWMANYYPSLIRRTEYDPDGEADTIDDYCRYADEERQAMQLIVQGADNELLASVGQYVANEEQRWRSGELDQKFFADTIQLALNMVRIVAEFQPGRFHALVAPFFAHGEGVLVAAILCSLHKAPWITFDPLAAFSEQIRNVEMDRLYPTYAEDVEFLLDIVDLANAAKAHVSVP
ncbi:MAG: hypothetical protein ABL962_04825 [Fimbriimonadaceae bacterium]